MFFKPEIDKNTAFERINAWLQPYLYLDKTKKEGMDERFKFTNDNNGVSKESLDFVNDVIYVAKKWQLTENEQIALIDMLVLMSNHLDQQKNDNINPKLLEENKKRQVLQFLEAAYKTVNISVEKMSDRMLSSMAQLYHYLGKARRYNNTDLKMRLILLQDAVEIASKLDDKHLSVIEDPHAYSSRLHTYQYPVIDTLLDLKEFEKAVTNSIKLFKEAPNHFHKVQSCVKVIKSLRQCKRLAEALPYAKEVLELAEKEPNPTLKFNAMREFMLLNWELENYNAAVELASQMLEAQEQDSNCGIKPDHIAAANKIIEEYQSISSLKM